MTVRAGDAAGLDRVLDVASRAGFGGITSRSPQVFIGNLGATLESLVSAFTIFPNHGLRRRPFVIDRIEDRTGEVIFRSGVVEFPAINPGLATVVGGVLEKALDPGGTGARARSLGYESPAGGKTGTTDDYHDAWFVGYSDRLTCGVWVGLDQPQQIVPRGFGSTLALPVWTDLMKHAEKIGYQTDVPRARAALTNYHLCRQSALLATSGCQGAGTAYSEPLPPELAPTSACTLHYGPPVTAAAQPADRPPSPPPGQPVRRVLEAIKNWFR
jgi:penicillin-binding protein 1A